MSNPDHRIQPAADLASASPPFREETGPETDHTMPPTGHPPGKLPAGMLFGGFVGLIMGALAGSACCWLTWQLDFRWHGATIGAALGFCLGAILGIKDMKAKGDVGRPDIATHIGVAYGLVPAVVILLGGLGMLGGRLSGYLLIAVAFLAPMLGMLLGAMLDRAYELFREKSWGAAVRFGIAGAVGCGGIAFVIAVDPFGPDPKQLARQARALLITEWRKQPELHAVTIQEISLVHKSGNTYTGFVNATLAGHRRRFSVEVVVGPGTIEVSWRPAE